MRRVLLDRLTPLALLANGEICFTISPVAAVPEPLGLHLFAAAVSAWARLASAPDSRGTVYPVFATCVDTSRAARSQESPVRARARRR
jgi:hypothetical protein